MNVLKKILVFAIAAVILTSCGKTDGIPAVTTDSETVTAIVTTEGRDVEASSPTETVTTITTEAIPAETVTEPVTEITTEVVTTPPAEEIATGNYDPVVFMYHLIMEEPYSIYDGLFVRPADFEAQLQAIVDSGAVTMFADEYKKTAVPSVIVTFDDGYEDNYTVALPLLEKYKVKATIFLVSDLIGTPGYMSEEQIRDMAKSPYIRFGCHTKSHQQLSQFVSEEVDRQFDVSKAVIRELVGYETRALAYPAGGYNDIVVGKAAERFDFAYTTKNPGVTSRDNMMLIPRYAVYRGYGASFVANCIG